MRYSNFAGRSFIGTAQQMGQPMSLPMGQMQPAAQVPSGGLFAPPQPPPSRPDMVKPPGMQSPSDSGPFYKAQPEKIGIDDRFKSIFGQEIGAPIKAWLQEARGKGLIDDRNMTPQQLIAAIRLKFPGWNPPEGFEMPSDPYRMVPYGAPGMNRSTFGGMPRTAGAPIGYGQSPRQQASPTMAGGYGYDRYLTWDV